MIKNNLVRDGWKVRFERWIKGYEKNNGNKKVDIVAIYDNDKGISRKVAIEVALSNYEVYTIMNCVDDGFDEVRVVCRDETARKRMEKDIYAAIDEMDQDSVIVQTINGFLNSMPQKT